MTELRIAVWALICGSLAAVAATTAMAGETGEGNMSDVPGISITEPAESSTDGAPIPEAASSSGDEDADGKAE